MTERGTTGCGTNVSVGQAATEIAGEHIETYARMRLLIPFNMDCNTAVRFECLYSTFHPLRSYSLRAVGTLCRRHQLCLQSSDSLEFGGSTGNSEAGSAVCTADANGETATGEGTQKRSGFTAFGSGSR